MVVSEVTAPDLSAELNGGEGPLLLDVRERPEWDICRIQGSTLVPLRELPGRLREIDSRREIVTICHRGIRSMRAVEILRSAGFPHVRSLQGGIDAWSVQVDPAVPRY